MRVVCIGDSITAGQHVEPEQAWPALLTGHEVIAAGVPGDTSGQGLIRFARDVQDRQPDAVVIQFGHNDANRWETDRGVPRASVAVFRANLADMVIRARAFDATPFLCTLTPSHRSERHAYDCDGYDAAVRVVAEDGLVRLIDARAAFDGQEGYLLGDGIHLSKAGHRAYAAAVQAALDEL